MSEVYSVKPLYKANLLLIDNTEHKFSDRLFKKISNHFLGVKYFTKELSTSNLEVKFLVSKLITDFQKARQNYYKDNNIILCFAESESFSDSMDEINKIRKSKNSRIPAVIVYDGADFSEKDAVITKKPDELSKLELMMDQSLLDCVPIGENAVQTIMIPCEYENLKNYDTIAEIEEGAVI